MKINVECMECGKKFKLSNPDSSCPKCGSVDLEVADYSPPVRKVVYRNYSAGPWDVMPEAA